MRTTPASGKYLNPYLIGFLLIYIANLVLADQFHTFETGDALGILIVVGIGFTTIAWLLSRKSVPWIPDQPFQSWEPYVLTLLVIYMTACIVLGNRIFFISTPDPGKIKEIVTIIRKVLTFVVIPFVAYRLLFNFGWKDFGLSDTRRTTFTGRNIMIFLGMSLVILLLNYYGGRGAKPMRDGLFSTYQLWVGLPLLFIWLLVEVGLVEEFFFRALLQNRLSVVLKSEMGAICITSLIFGLVHAPGMYFRNAGVIEGLGGNPSLLSSIGYCIAIQSVPGFFLGVIWSKTKNLWLLMGIHAMVDLLPNFPEFVSTWGI